jgi:hypothetical protein
VPRIIPGHLPCQPLKLKLAAGAVILISCKKTA